MKGKKKRDNKNEPQNPKTVEAHRQLIEKISQLPKIFEEGEPLY